MALDMHAHGRTPYQKLEKPQSTKQSLPHVKRYFARILESLLLTLAPLIVFLVPVSVFQFAGSVGFIRQLLWVVLSVFLTVVWGILIVWLRSEMILTYKRIIGTLSVGIFLIIIVSLFVQNTALSIGVLRLGGEPTLFVYVLGGIWVVILSGFTFTLRFFKSLVIAHFLGTTVFALYVLIVAWFGGGYDALSWFVTQSWGVVIAITIFMMTAFAMLQKPFAKVFWSFCIAVQVLTLFIWDTTLPWLLIIIGTSVLLVFQMTHAKKLWQRNVTYPLQVWVAAVLFLFIPVKVFSGTTVPLPEQFSFSELTSLVQEQSLPHILFGNGIGTADMLARFSGESFYSVEEGIGDTAEQPKSIANSVAYLLLELGGIFSILLLYIVVLFVRNGYLFLKRHIASLAKHTMTESVYVGSLVFLGSLLIGVSLLFTSWSFSLGWLLFLLIGLTLGLWNTSALVEARIKGAKEVPVTFDRYIFSKGVFFTGLKLIVLVGIVGSLFVCSYSIRVVGAERAVRAAHIVEDPLITTRKWEDAVARNPWNERYRVEHARADVLSLEGSSLDIQKNVIERTTQQLQHIRETTTDPTILWRAALSYRDMEQYAEGSARLARTTYLDAQRLWESNRSLPVAIARFYRESIDDLAHADMSAQALREEAMQLLKKTLSEDPTYLPARLELSFILELAQGASAALSELEPYETESPEIMYHVGRLYFNEGDFETAVEKFNIVVQAVPNHSNAHYSLGVAHFRLEEYDDSLTSFEKVLELNPENTDVQEKIKQVREAIGIE